MSGLFTLFAQQCTGGSFFGLAPWYKYLQSCNADGTLDSFRVLPETVDGKEYPSDIPYVLLAIIDDIIRIAALVAIAFIIYGAMQYIASQGSPEATSKAKNTVINALIGLVVAVVAVGVVGFIGKSLQ